MARTVRDAKTDTRTARHRLLARREPYWTWIAPGRALGYRKGVKGGFWIAKYRDASGKRSCNALGAADDVLEPDGRELLSFSQAQAKARDWFDRTSRQRCNSHMPCGKFTVRHAIEDYLSWFERNRKSVNRTRSVCEYAILPRLGDFDAQMLTKKQIEDWHAEIASQPAKLRTSTTATRINFRPLSDSEAARRRRSTANRVLTVLKAALNHAYREGHIDSDDAWRRVRPFRGVDVARSRYLVDDEIERLADACTGSFRDLVLAGLMTGARYGELMQIKASDLDCQAGTIHIRTSKNGKGRYVILIDEGLTFFRRLAYGKGPEALVLTKDNGTSWKASEPQRPLKRACKAARIEPAIGFHMLRHTYASRLAMSGVPLAIIAAQLGHSDTRMVEKHYGHLAPSYIADTIHAMMTPLGVIKPEELNHVRM